MGVLAMGNGWLVSASWVSSSTVPAVPAADPAAGTPPLELAAFLAIVRVVSAR